MRVLVACEESGVVRDGFLALGHEAMSCDLLPTRSPGPHYKGDVRDVLGDGWDMMLAFPPCTDLAVSGARHFAAKRADGRQAGSIAFFMLLANSDIPRVAIENPVGIMSSLWRKPDQVIQPWQFGHPETKATCLWLKGLPKLQPTNDVREEMMMLPLNKRARIHHMPPGPNRARERSATYSGIAAAIAQQWGQP